MFGLVEAGSLVGRSGALPYLVVSTPGTCQDLGSAESLLSRQSPEGSSCEPRLRVSACHTPLHPDAAEVAGVERALVEIDRRNDGRYLARCSDGLEPLWWRLRDHELWCWLRPGLHWRRWF